MSKNILIISFILSSFLNLNAQDKDKCLSISADVIRLFQQEKTDSIYLMFDEKMKSGLSEENLSAIWPSFIASDGTFQRYENQRDKTIQSFLVVESDLVFENKSYILRLTFDANNNLAGMFFVPIKTSKNNQNKLEDNADYKEENAIVKTGKIKLPAIVCLPKNTSKYPIVVFVHGSGPNDKDETIGPNKIFMDLAHHFFFQAEDGIRYDKRTYVVQSTGDTSISYSGINEIVIDDAVSAIEMAEKIVPKGSKVFLIGHSMGAMLAPAIAQRKTMLGGVVMLAGNARPLEDLIMEQTQYLYGRDGLSKAEKKDLCKLKKKVKNVKKLDKFLTKGQSPELPLTNDTAFWRDFHQYNQIETAQLMRMPVYILQGERDYQVSMKDFNLWKESLGGKKNFEFKSFPKLNHIFHEGEGLSWPEEYNIQGNIPDYVVSEIAHWLLNNN